MSTSFLSFLGLGPYQPSTTAAASGAQVAARASLYDHVSDEPRPRKRRRKSQSPGNSPQKRKRQREKWDPAKVGFFEPGHVDEEHIRMKDGQMYFKHVVAFLNRLRSLTLDKDSKMMQEHLRECLRGVAMEWHMSELTTDERQSLRNSPLEDGWFKELEKRFKPSPRASARAMSRRDFFEKYTYDYISPVVWAHEMFRLAQVAFSEAELHEQLGYIWYRLDSSLLRYVPKPSKKTSVAKFMKDIDTVYNAVSLGVWWSYNGRARDIEDELKEYFQ